MATTNDSSLDRKGKHNTRRKPNFFIIALCLLLVIILGQAAIAATGSEYIWTDEPRYLNGDTAHIFGTGFAPYTPILIKVTRPDGSIVTGDGMETPGSDTIVTNIDGNLAYTYSINGMQAEGTYIVEAIDAVPDPGQILATTSFIDPAQFLLQGCSWHKGDCTQEALPGWANGATPMDGWTSGVLKGWAELQYVPYRLRINLPKPGDAGTYYITNEHDNLRNGIPGVDDTREYYVGKLSDGTLTKTCSFQATRTKWNNPTSLNPCIVTGHTYTGVNDDPAKDLNIDEDPTDGLDNDSDNLVDEDPSGSYTPARKIQDTWAVLFESGEAGNFSEWALYWKAHLAIGSSGFPGASLHGNTTATGNQDVPILNIRPAPQPVCGNSILDPGEECDDGNNIDGDGCSATCQLEPSPPLPDLYINKSYAGTPNPGKTLSFTVRYGNTGEGNATNVVVTDNYDQRYVTPHNICCGGIDDGDKITWSVGTVSAMSGPFVLTYDGTIHDGTPDTTAHMPVGNNHVVNVATITTSSTDADPSDNISTVDILLHAEPNLFVTKLANSAAQVWVRPGNTVTITLTYGNPDNNDAPNVTLCDDYNQTYLLPVPSTLTDEPGEVGVDNGDKICWGLTPGSLLGVIPGTRTLPGIDPQVSYQALVIDHPVDWEDTATITTSDPEPLFKLVNNTSTVQFKVEKPTAVRLSSFAAINTGGQATISWRTGSEIDSEGFYIWRSSDMNGQYVRITPALIASQGSAIRGESYSFVDPEITGQCNDICYYILEEIDARGISTKYGPVAAIAENPKEKDTDTHLSMSIKSQGSDYPGSYDSGNNLYGSHSSMEWVAGDVHSPIIPNPAYTGVALADGTVKFTSDEVFTSLRLTNVHENPPPLNPLPQGEGKQIPPPLMGGGQGEGEGRGSSNEVIDDESSHESIRFSIIDPEGNEITVVSLNQVDGNSEQVGRTTLHTIWDKDHIILTWYAVEPVKGFHILRSTNKEGPYDKITKTLIPYLNTLNETNIFHYTYIDKNVQKGKTYYYKLEPVYDDVIKVVEVNPYPSPQ